METLEKDMLEKLEKIENEIKSMKENDEIERKNIPSVPKNPIYEAKSNLGKQLKSIISQGNGYFNVEKAANVEGTDAYGGYLVPLEKGAFIQNPNDYGFVRKGATIVPMKNDKKELPYVASDVTAHTPGEYAAGTTSNPVFGVVKLDSDTRIALVPSSREFIEDADYQVAEIIGSSITKQFSGAEDALFVTRLNALSNAQTTTASTYATFAASCSASIFSDLQAKLQAINMTYDEGAVYIMNPTSLAAVRNLQDDQHRPIVNIADGIVTIYTKPVILSNKMQSASTTSAGAAVIAYGNLKNAYLGERSAVQFEISTQAYLDASNNMFTQHGTCIKGSARFDVQLDPNAFVVYEYKS